MTAVHRWGAAYMTLGLSMRVSELDDIDSEAGDSRDWFVPA